MRKNYLCWNFLIVLILLYSGLMIHTSEHGKTASSLNIIPEPASTEVFDGSFTLAETTPVYADCEKSEETAQYFAEELSKRAGLNVEVDTTGSGDDEEGVYLEITDNVDLPHEEGYHLEIEENRVKVRASTQQGLFYGIQSLLQLIDPVEEMGEPQALPSLKITDYPEFDWRGMHLDVCRHFFSTDFIKEMLDLMAMHKMNSFHWHLTEDQGWRIEIEEYPRLTEVGAWRDCIGFELDPADSTHYNEKGEYGGYYSREEIKEIIEYAQSLHINIVPEIEMPGHAMAALTAYPELSCTGGPFEIPLRGGVFDDVFCAGKDETFEFLKNVLSEVIDLFPGKYVHIGGDECPKTRWEECEDCQQRIEEEGLADEDELQSYFIHRIEEFLSEKDKRLIGWDEIKEGGLAPGATVMSWRGKDPGIQAAKDGHDVVMSPTSHCYFDFYQWEAEEPRAIGGLIKLEDVYTFRPAPPEIPEDKRHHILGGQGNIWTEDLPNRDAVTYMALPRMSALSETVWSPEDKRDWEDFSQRLLVHLQRLEARDVDYRVPGGITIEEKEKGKIEMTPELPDSEIYYTVNGTEPGPHSSIYEEPLTFEEPTLVRARVILPDKKMGHVFEHISNRPSYSVDANIHFFAQDVPENIFDGFHETYFQSRWAPNDNAYLTLTFDEPYSAERLLVFSGDERKDWQIKDGIVEVSEDGETFEKLSEFNHGIAVGDLNFDVKALRVSITKDHSDRVIIRELQFEEQVKRR